MERRDKSTSHGNEIEEYVSINIQKTHIPLSNSIRKMIDDLPHVSNGCCIFRVPKRMRDSNEKAFTPQAVSIGPLHRGKEHLRDMEELKPRYLQSFLNRIGNMSLEGCITVVKDWEERARSYYAESILLSSDEFVKMILLDGSFIIEVMYWFIVDPFMKENVGYLERQLEININDVILLENQLPFFVLEGLFNLVSSPTKTISSFLELSLRYFFTFCIVEDVNPPFLSSEVKHFVDLIRLHHLPSSQRSPTLIEVKYVPGRNATELQEAGIKFKKGSSNRLLDIQYAMEVLEIPPLMIGQLTEPLLRNLVALEQFYYSRDSYIIDYIHFMDSLIDTAKDADLLIQERIFENYLGNSIAVVDLFNNLTKEVGLWTPNYYFYDLSEKLNAYCTAPRATINRDWKATLKRDYFSTPWRTASTIAAIILLVLTLVQTICSILSL